MRTPLLHHRVSRLSPTTAAGRLAATLIAVLGLLAVTSGGIAAAAGLPAAGQTGNAAAAPGGLTASVQGDGSWTVTASSPHWTFGGSVGAPVGNVHSTAGQDRIGSYHQVTFDYQANGPRQSSIRVHDNTPVVLFSTTYLAAEPNGSPFPVISSHPQLPYQQSYHGCFGVYQFNTTSGASDSPWLAFDADENGYLLSPASHFEQASMSMGADGSISSGITSSVATLPAGFTQQTTLTVGHGVNGIYRNWGTALTSLTGKSRPASDDGVLLNKLGYWTDHGATYYYSYDPSLGYEGTLEAVGKDWADKGIPMGYMQLDSWFYPKGPQAQWNDGAHGEYTYEASPQLFPDGLAGFHNQLGVPLVTHARWIDPSSPYHSQYQMSGNVVTDPRFWQDRMNYLHNSGVASYEQDWLCAGAQPQYNLTDPDAFFGNMAKYAAANGMTMQYCMPMPRNYLQTALYSNLTNMRVSDDRFEPGKWDNFLFDSQLAGSLGVWPFTDVFMSTETDNLLLADLSGGPVGVGDGIGQESKANLMQVARPDGVIVKPDAPLVPDDQTYLGEAQGSTPPMVATSYSDHGGGIQDAYVFSYARQTPQPQQVYQAEDATLSGPIAAADNPGYTGTGYADYQNASGDYAQWTVQAPAAGTYTLEFRYANGGSGNRPLDIALNGADQGTLPFAPTGGWSSWKIQPMTVQLQAGANTIRATATGQSGGNIDYLGISQGQVPTSPTQTASFQPSAMGISGAAYVYNYFTGQGAIVPPGGSFHDTVTSGTYWVVAPVGRSGIAFLGDAGKFVSLGSKRISALSDDGAVHATVAFAPGEGAVTLHGYSPSDPRAVGSPGTAGPVSYDPATGIFSVQVAPPAGQDKAGVTIIPQQ